MTSIKNILFDIEVLAKDIYTSYSIFDNCILIKTTFGERFVIKVEETI